MKSQTRLSLYFILSLSSLLFASLATARSLPEFADLAEKNAPAVVNISTKQASAHSQMQHYNMPDLDQFPEDSPFGELLRRFFGEHGLDAPHQGDIEKQSLGSGFIISEDGYILTNNHVVADADEIIVRMADRREFVAKLIGTDERSDISLIKIDAEGLPVVKIGKSTDLRVGEWVLAIGSPFGFDHSVTAGIVSAKGRNLPSENYVPFIQTDVAINPGNSGGPLFNLDGEVVGVNSQIYSRSGGFMGLSFAIPIDVAMNVADQLKSRGRVSRGWLGVLIQDVTRELAESFNMDRPRGALVARVLPDSPSEKAGVKVGDIILSYNGTELRHSSELPPLVGNSRIDRPAELEVMRHGKPITLQVNIAELPSDEEIKIADKGVPEKVEENRLGLRVSELTDEMRGQLGLNGMNGLLVEAVNGEAAREAGIQPGDVLLMLNNKEIDSVDGFNKLVEGFPAGKTVAVLVQRDDGPLFLALRIPEK